ncbi:MAG: hypothetical protein OXB99_01260 [Acidimicrobiaceae bacterium]|nr:hypothetical protein [Acidimicrobiaceae bacterium]
MPRAAMPRRLLGALCAMLTAAALLAVTAQPAAAESGGARWPADMKACAGATAVVVASDPAAQSDVYSAVTLAGVLDTSCLIDAGARAAAMPTASVALLDSAAESVYVVGGLAAVPDAKLHGRSIHRVAGADRWATARAAGAVAEQIAAGDTLAFASVSAPPAAAGFTAMSGGGWGACGLRVDGSLACWLYDRDSDAVVSVDLPVSGKFTAVTGRGSWGCGLRVDGTLACWKPDYDSDAVVSVDLPVSGKFTAVSAGWWNDGCGLRVDGTLACWLYDRRDSGAVVSVDLPVSGKFTAVIDSGSDDGCGLRVDGTLACWEYDYSSGAVVSVDLPVSGKFTAVSGGGSNGCGLRVDGTLACWWHPDYFGPPARGVDLPVSGKFTAVSGGWNDGCGLRVDGSLACWRNAEGDGDMQSLIEDPEDRVVDPPVSGKFTAVSGGGSNGCGLRADGSLECWRYDHGSRAVVSVDLPV